MALTSTLFRFDLELADIDRAVYESLPLRVACHPSEDHERLVVRVLARALAHEEGLEFGRGLSHSDDPALSSPSPRGGGDIATWIDVGAPTAERLHRASKKADRVKVYTDKPPDNLRRVWSKSPVHEADALELTFLPTEVIGPLAATLTRTMQWHITVLDAQLTVVFGDATHTGALERMSLASFLA